MTEAVHTRVLLDLARIHQPPGLDPQSLWDYADGIALVKLLEKLSNWKYDSEKYKRKLKLKKSTPDDMKKERISGLMKFIKDEKISDRKFDPCSELSPKTVLSLLEVILVHYLVTKPLAAILASDAPPRMMMLTWIRKTLPPGAKTFNLHDDWKSGVLFCAMIHSKSDGELCRYWRNLDRADSQKHLKLAFGMAASEFSGINKLLRAEDFLDGSPSETALMLYLAQFIGAKHIQRQMAPGADTQRSEDALYADYNRFNVSTQEKVEDDPDSTIDDAPQYEYIDPSQNEIPWRDTEMTEGDSDADSDDGWGSDFDDDEDDAEYRDTPRVPSRKDTKRAKREMCMNEILLTEKNYSEFLSDMVKFCLRPLKTCLSLKDYIVIFYGIEELYNLHKNFLDDLRRSQTGPDSSDSQPVSFSECWAKYKEKFLIYGDLTTNLPSAQGLVGQLQASNIVIRNSIQDCEQKGFQGRFPLRELLSVPMQRILKYHLLLKELLKHTAPTDPERPGLQHALEEMQDLSLHLNEVKRDNEMLKLIQDLQQLITDLNLPPETQLKDYGRLHQQGQIVLRNHDETSSKNRYVFLFDKVMLLTTKTKWTDKYKCCEWIDLELYKMESTNNVPSSYLKVEKGWSYSFLLIEKTPANPRMEGMWTIHCKTEESQKDWMKAMDTALDNVQPDCASDDDMDFQMFSFQQVTPCDVCNKLLRGAFYQGYKSEKTGISVHKDCIPKAVRAAEQEECDTTTEDIELEEVYEDPGPPPPARVPPKPQPRLSKMPSFRPSDDKQLHPDTSNPPPRISPKPPPKFMAPPPLPKLPPEVPIPKQPTVKLPQHPPPQPGNIPPPRPVPKPDMGRAPVPKPGMGHAPVPQKPVPKFPVPKAPIPKNITIKVDEVEEAEQDDDEDGNYQFDHAAEYSACSAPEPIFKPEIVKAPENKWSIENTKGTKEMTEAWKKLAESDKLSLDNMQKTVNSYMCDPDNLKLGPQIGHGNSGTVYKGRYTNDNHIASIVAAKVVNITFRGEKGVNQWILVFKEIYNMAQFDHKNVVQLLAVMIKGRMPYLIQPLYKSDLHTYVSRSRKKLSKLDLNSKVLDVAHGMAHLSHLEFIHRDLSARNCMMDSKGVVKIGDLGLMRDIMAQDYVSLGDTKIAFRWTALESLKDKCFNIQSDVWSFGVLYWEVLSWGAKPFQDVMTDKDLRDRLEHGHRLGKPQFAKNNEYRFMRECWDADSEKRPTFEEIVVFFKHRVERNDNDSSDEEAINDPIHKEFRPALPKRYENVGLDDAPSGKARPSKPLPPLPQ